MTHFLIDMSPIKLAAISGLRVGILKPSGFIDYIDPITLETHRATLVAISDFIQWAKDKNIKLHENFPQSGDTYPEKRNPESMKHWIKYRMLQDGVNLGSLPRGYQQKLIREAQQYGFDEQGTAVKRAFKALKT